MGLRTARAFLHCSSTAVYRPRGHHALSDEDDLGDNHGVWPLLRMYSICKIAAEATARWASLHHGLPTTIARLCGPYGDDWGWPAFHLKMMLDGAAIPVHLDAPACTTRAPRRRPRDRARAAARGVGAGHGGERRRRAGQHRGVVRVGGRAVRLEVRFDPTEHTIDSTQLDLSRLRRLAGPPTVPWRDGICRVVAARHRERLVGHGP